MYMNILNSNYTTIICLFIIVLTLNYFGSQYENFTSISQLYKLTNLTGFTSLTQKQRLQLKNRALSTLNTAGFNKVVADAQKLIDANKTAGLTGATGATGPTDTTGPTGPTGATGPAADQAAADQAAADQAAADQAAADKAAADQAIVDKAAADKAAAEKVLADKAVADQEAADKAEEKAAADKRNLIIGIVVGSSLFILCIGVLIFLFSKRRRQRYQKNNTYD